MTAFDDLVGNPSAGTHVSEGEMRHVLRRAQRLAGRGVMPPGVSGIRARAADQVELAREISRAIEGNDMNLARALIAEGAAAYGHAALSSAVEAAARQVHEAAVAEHYQASVNAARDVDEPYHAPGLADRQRENLRQFDDGGELVRSWRMGNVSWDYDAWGQTRTIRHVLMDNLDLGCEQAAEQVDSGGGSGGGLAMQAVSAAW